MPAWHAPFAGAEDFPPLFLKMAFSRRFCKKTQARENAIRYFLFGIGCCVGITVGYICISRILHGFFTGKYILKHCPPLCTLLGEAIHCRKVVAYISKHCIVEFHIRIITVRINLKGTSYREEAGRFYTLGTCLLYTSDAADD